MRGTSNNQMTIACIGDSLTAWTLAGNGSTGWIEHMQSLYQPSLVIRNFGAGGHTCEQCLADFNANVLGRGFRKLNVLCGINDLINGTSAVAAYAHLEDMFEAALADSTIEKINAYSVTPCGNHASWTAGKQTEIEAFNALIEAEADASGGVIRFIDLYAELGEPGSPTLLRTTDDNGDGLHWNGTGHSRARDLAKSYFITL